MKLTLPEIRHNIQGFQELVRLAAETKACSFGDISIDMSNVNWFDADMCALFGAILYRLGDSMNRVRLINICPKVERILSKNGFLCHYGGEKISDLFGTTIPYQRFDVKDDRYFSDYIENELIHRSEIPPMSAGLLKKFRESIFEIFSNAVWHSRTKMGIFSCGQLFPKRNTLDFSVADLGIGMQRNITELTGLVLSPVEAIQWATQGSNTTRRGSIPGGLGLKLLCEFIDLNGGHIQIVSGMGYWGRKDRRTFTELLAHPFDGTVVSVQINTADKNSYKLVSEPSITDIF